MTRRGFVKGIGAALVAAGLAVIGAPPAAQWLYARGAEDGERRFASDAAAMRSDGGASQGVDLQGLLDAMRDYNLQIDASGQSALVDAWSYERPSFRLEDWGLPSEVVGYLDVPHMGATLPIYLGATEDNMSKGAVQLSQTSLPIGSWGGSSNNTVIAAHRNHWSAGLFHDIDKMRPGDPVYVENLWGSLTYHVSGTTIIDPSDIDAVRIQPGRDMVTLISCHPLYHNYQRFVVYCERDET